MNHATNVYIIRKSLHKQYFTVHDSKTHRPAIMAFQLQSHCKTMKHLLDNADKFECIQDPQKMKRPYQKLNILQVGYEHFVTTCALNNIDVCIVDDTFDCKTIDMRCLGIKNCKSTRENLDYLFGKS